MTASPQLTLDKQHLFLLDHPFHWSAASSGEPLSVFSRPWVSENTQSDTSSLCFNNSAGVETFLLSWFPTGAASCPAGTSSCPAGCWAALRSERKSSPSPHLFLKGAREQVARITLSWMGPGVTEWSDSSWFSGIRKASDSTVFCSPCAGQSYATCMLAWVSFHFLQVIKSPATVQKHRGWSETLYLF